jgi:Zn-dependent protease with chaperone function
MAYLWGLPWVAREIAQQIPDSIESQAGDVGLRHVQGLTQPSKLPEQEQQAIEHAWQKVLTAHTLAQQAKGVAIRPTRLLIRDSAIGPNALALPGGVIVLTDDMVRLVRNDAQVLSGVLAHELGHVQKRHGMQMLVQISVLGLVASVVWGDYSGVLAAVPLWVGHAHYSRSAEREADAYSAEVLRDAGVAPAVMVSLFERLQLFKQCGRSVLEPQTVRTVSNCKRDKEEPDGDDNGMWGLGFSSHPTDESRIAFFRGLPNVQAK